MALPPGFTLEQPAQPNLPAGFALEGNAPAPTPEPRSWGSTLGSAAMNLPGSVYNLGKDIATAVAHPIDTLGGISDLAAGGLQNAIKAAGGESIVNWIGADKDSQAKAAKFGQYMKEGYGSVEGFKKRLAEDPAGVLADASIVLTGGGSVISKLPMLEKVGQATVATGKAIDPLLNTARVAGLTKDIVTGGAKAGAGLTTGAGSVPLSQAYQAGRQGGTAGESFQANLRGNVPKTDVLNDVSSNLSLMGKAKSDAYKANMASVGKSDAVLSFEGIDNAIKDTDTAYKGQTINEKAAQATQRIKQAVEEWRNLDPAEYHTPEGMDALKKKIGGIVEEIPYTDQTARRVGDSVYHAVKSEIVKQAPEYSKAMKDYSEATDLIHEIKMTLSQNPKASVDTQMRKLQSLTRNNVNTNYGNRLDLVNKMTEAGGTDILPAVSGQALNSWTPRGLAGAVAVPTAFFAGGPAGAAMLGAGSPRLMGEGAYYSGKLASAIRNPMDKVGSVLKGQGVDPYVLGNTLYQMNQQQRGNK